MSTGAVWANLGILAVLFAGKMLPKLGWCLPAGTPLYATPPRDVYDAADVHGTHVRHNHVAIRPERRHHRPYEVLIADRGGSALGDQFRRQSHSGSSAPHRATVNHRPHEGRSSDRARSSRERSAHRGVETRPWLLPRRPEKRPLRSRTPARARKRTRRSRSHHHPSLGARDGCGRSRARDRRRLRLGRRCVGGKVADGLDRASATRPTSPLALAAVGGLMLVRSALVDFRPFQTGLGISSRRPPDRSRLRRPAAFSDGCSAVVSAHLIGGTGSIILGSALLLAGSLLITGASDGRSPAALGACRSGSPGWPPSARSRCSRTPTGRARAPGRSGVAARSRRSSCPRCWSRSGGSSTAPRRIQTSSATA